MHILGDARQFLDPFNATINDLVPHEGAPFPVKFSRAVSFQLITEGTSRQFLANGTTDNIVASTHTWTLANGTFVAGDAGGKLYVLGTVSNDGVYNIASVTNGTTIVSDLTQANETFPATAIFVVVPPGTLDGSWKIEVSNDYIANIQASGASMPLYVPHWTDVTAGFTGIDGTALATVAHGTAATRNQYVQPKIAAPIAPRYMRITFTATAGTGFARAIVCGEAQ